MPIEKEKLFQMENEIWRKDVEKQIEQNNSLKESRGPEKKNGILSPAVYNKPINE